MGAALSVFVLLSVSVFVIRVASVALRLTGLSEETARFQALSAFTGTGFTTVEAELVVNYPVRRKIASLLMIVGNLGIVSLLAAVVVSMVNTEGEIHAIANQMAWFLAGMALFWGLMLNKRADRLMCSALGRLLMAMTRLGRRSYQRLAQISDGLSVCEHPVKGDMQSNSTSDLGRDLSKLGLRLLAVRRAGETLPLEEFPRNLALSEGDALILYGNDDSQEALAGQAVLSHND